MTFWPKCCSKEMTGCQYRGTKEDYDGVSEYQCIDCGKRVGRWSGKELKTGELEPRDLRFKQND